MLVQKKKSVGCNTAEQANRNQSHRTAVVVNEMINTRNDNWNAEKKEERRMTDCKGNDCLGICWTNATGASTKKDEKKKLREEKKEKRQ